jgi:hypothetical protein
VFPPVYFKEYQMFVLPIAIILSLFVLSMFAFLFVVVLRAVKIRKAEKAELFERGYVSVGGVSFIRRRFEMPLISTVLPVGLMLFALLIALIPFNTKYWFITSESGTVTNIQTQTVLTDEDATQLTPQFVVTLNEDTEVIMDDPRIQNVKVGDKLNLNCSWEFVYAGADKQNCIPQ